MVLKTLRKIPIIDAGFTLLWVYRDVFCWVPEQKFALGRDGQMSLAELQLALWQLLFPPPCPNIILVE